MHETGDKGDIAVAYVKADLIANGYQVLLPVSAYLPFDLVIYTPNGNFYRIQVKYRTKTKNGTLLVEFRRAINNRRVLKYTTLTTTHTDLYAIYCPDTHKCYYFSRNLTTNRSIALRVDPTKQKQQKGVNLAKDFESITKAIEAL